MAAGPGHGAQARAAADGPWSGHDGGTHHRSDPTRPGADITAAELRHALLTNELTLVYQPQVDLATGRLSSVEALLRWNHPRLGPLLPAQFLHAITRDGMWRPITGRVIDQAVSDAASWRRAGAPIRVWVNVAATDVARESALASQIFRALDEHDLPGELLGLELTESGVLRSLDDAVDVLASLRDAGIGVALDDFGTGFSSLTHLRRLPVSSVKIDRSFVQLIDSSPADAAITGAIIEVCRSLGVDSTVEGVERVAEWDAVARLGATKAQGFLLARPGPAAHAPRWRETSWSALVAERRRDEERPLALHLRSEREADAGRERDEELPPPRGTPFRDPRFAIWADRLTSSLDSAITIVRFDGTFGYVSPSITALLGREPHALTATNYLDLVHSDDVSDVQRAIRRLASSVRPASRVPLGVCRLSHADGSWIVAELTGATDLHGDPIDGMVLVMRRISASTSSDARIKRLRQLNERLARVALGSAPMSMVDGLGDAMRELAEILGVDAAAIEGLILPENRCALLGAWDRRTGRVVSRADGIEQRLTDMATWMDVVAADSVILVEDLARSGGEPWAAEVGGLWLDRDGVRTVLAVPRRALGRPVEVLTVACRGDVRHFDDKEIAALGDIATTISHGLVRIHAEKALPPRDERLGMLVLDAEDLMCVMDTVGTIRHVTPASTRLLGRAPEELVGRHVFEVLHPDDAESARRALRQIRAVGRSELLEGRVRHADGSWRWVEASARLVMQGDADGIVFVIRDITERIAARERHARAQELEQLALQLSQRALRAEMATSPVSLDAFARELARLLGIDLVFIDELEGSLMTSRAAFVPPTSLTEVLPTYDLRDHPALAKQLERREAFFFDDCPVEPDVWSTMESDPGDDHGGALLPLIANGRLVGSLALSSRAPHQWTAAERTSLLLIADTLAAMFERQRLEESRDRIEGRFRILADHAADVVTLCDEAGVLLYVSPASTEMIGMTPSELVGTRVFDLVHPDDQANFDATLQQLLAGKDVTFEFRLVRPDGAWLWVSNRSRKVNLDGGRTEFWGSMRDVSERRRLEMELLHRASHDPLTDLPNRTVFRRSLTALAEARDLPASLVVIDLDGFKAVNDTFGHPAGDHVLVEIAERLRSVVRESDVVTRVGGDEFLVLCPRTGHRDAARLVDRLMRHLPAPIDLGDGRYVTVGCSVGVATGHDVPELEQLLHHADAAMYDAKASRRKRVVFSMPDQPG